MTIVPVLATLGFMPTAVTLPRYAQFIGYKEEKFFGINVPTVNDEIYDVQDIWIKRERDMVMKYLALAQEDIEKRINYRLSPVWTVAERHRYSPMIKTAWLKIIALGVKVSTEIIGDLALDLSTDPISISQAGFTGFVEDEIHFFYPNTEIEIFPSAMTIIGDTLTAQIPKARLVDVNKQDNPRTGWEYTDNAIYTPAVDIVAWTNNPTLPASLVTEDATCNTCTETVDPTCAFLSDAKNGLLRINLHFASVCGGCPGWVLINYKSGMDLTPTSEDAIIRLAHSYMPHPPCGDALAKVLWDRDTKISENPSAERQSCPFGLSDGAWAAWMFCRGMVQMRGGMFA